MQGVQRRNAGRPRLRDSDIVRKKTVWLHDDLIDKIRKASQGRSISDFIRNACEAALNDNS